MVSQLHWPREPGYRRGAPRPCASMGQLARAGHPEHRRGAGGGVRGAGGRDGRHAGHRRAGGQRQLPQRGGRAGVRPEPAAHRGGDPAGEGGHVSAGHRQALAQRHEHRPHSGGRSPRRRPRPNPGEHALGDGDGPWTSGAPPGSRRWRSLRPRPQARGACHGVPGLPGRGPTTDRRWRHRHGRGRIGLPHGRSVCGPGGVGQLRKSLGAAPRAAGAGATPSPRRGALRPGGGRPLATPSTSPHQQEAPPGNHQAGLRALVAMRWRSPRTGCAPRRGGPGCPRGSSASPPPRWAGQGSTAGLLAGPGRRGAGSRCSR